MTSSPWTSTHKANGNRPSRSSLRRTTFSQGMGGQRDSGFPTGGKQRYFVSTAGHSSLSLASNTRPVHFQEFFEPSFTFLSSAPSHGDCLGRVSAEHGPWGEGREGPGCMGVIAWGCWNNPVQGHWTHQGPGAYAVRGQGGCRILRKRMISQTAEEKGVTRFSTGSEKWISNGRIVLFWGQSPKEPSENQPEWCSRKGKSSSPNHLGLA